jgi:hypothetical protein
MSSAFTKLLRLAESRSVYEWLRRDSLDHSFASAELSHAAVSFLNSAVRRN